MSSTHVLVPARPVVSALTAVVLVAVPQASRADCGRDARVSSDTVIARPLTAPATSRGALKVRTYRDRAARLAPAAFSDDAPLRVNKERRETACGDVGPLAPGLAITPWTSAGPLALRPTIAPPVRLVAPRRSRDGLFGGALIGAIAAGVFGAGSDDGTGVTSGTVGAGTDVTGGTSPIDGTTGGTPGGTTSGTADTPTIPAAPTTPTSGDTPAGGTSTNDSPTPSSPGSGQEPSQTVPSTALPSVPIAVPSASEGPSVPTPSASTSAATSVSGSPGAVPTTSIVGATAVPVTPTAVTTPEPASVILIGTGLFALGVIGRTRSRQS